MAGPFPARERVLGKQVPGRLEAPRGGLELWLFWVAALLETVLTLPGAPGSHTESEDSIKPAEWLETLVDAHHDPHSCACGLGARMEQRPYTARGR